MKSSCQGCGNTRRKTYHHESGRQLCQPCLVNLARDGRRDFRTPKSRAGYTRKDGVYVPPIRSAKQEREHDDIARRDQEAADRTPPPQFDYKPLQAPADVYNKTAKRRPKGWDGAHTCILCGSPCVNPRYFVWEHCGGGILVTRAEGERLNASDQGGSDLGGQPIGADCLRKHPELRPYVNEE